MSGLAGIFNLDGQPVEPGDLARMVASMVRRGPDGSGVWSEGPVGLGHCMLWTTPESLHETLPRTNGAGTLAITADARIDNRTELISALALSDVRPANISDSDLILAAYEKWGQECPARLIGDFAFAIWDSRRQTLFCARDHFGVKPFCYYRSDQLFAFASEVKALLSLPFVPCRVNEDRIADYLVPQLEGIDKVSTFYQEIFRFPPASSMSVGSQQVAQCAYWRLDPTKELSFNSDDEYVEAFREIFTEAVRCRLRSAFPVGSMLSGGMDSSSIVGVARKLPPNNEADTLHTISAISEDEGNSPETKAIKAMISMGGIKAHSIRSPQYGTAITDLCYILDNTDDLFDTDLMGIPLLVYSTARKHGLKVVLDGVPGDNVVSQGPKCLAYLLRAGRWKTAMIEAAGYGRLYQLSPAKLLWTQLKLAFIPHSWRKIRRALNQKNRFDLAIDNTIINPDFARRIHLIERLDILHGTGWFTTRLNSLREDHWNELHHPYITVALERYGRVAAAHSIEACHPFMDKRLVEFGLALPWDQKVHQGWSKIILRRAMAGYLPEGVRWRRDKTDLVNEFGRPWFASTQKLMEEVVTDHLERIAEYININACLEAYQRYRTQGALDDAYKVWQAVTLALWLNRSLLLSA